MERKFQYWEEAACGMKKYNKRVDNILLQVLVF